MSKQDILTILRVELKEIDEMISLLGGIKSVSNFILGKRFAIDHLIKKIERIDNEI